jgi:hypothetical protein
MELKRKDFKRHVLYFAHDVNFLMVILQIASITFLYSNSAITREVVMAWTETLESFTEKWKTFPLCQSLSNILYCTKTLIANKCTKKVLSSIVTHSYIFRPCWVIFRENFFVIVTLRLHFIVEWECAVDCVLRCFWRHELSAIRACRPGSQRVHASSTQTTAHSHSTMKCNLSVMVTTKFSLKMTQRGRNM